MRGELTPAEHRSIESRRLVYDEILKANGRPESNFGFVALVLTVRGDRHA